MLRRKKTAPTITNPKSINFAEKNTMDKFTKLISVLTLVINFSLFYAPRIWAQPTSSKYCHVKVEGYEGSMVQGQSNTYTIPDVVTQITVSILEPNPEIKNFRFYKLGNSGFITTGYFVDQYTIDLTKYPKLSNTATSLALYYDNYDGGKIVASYTYLKGTHYAYSDGKTFEFRSQETVGLEKSANDIPSYLDYGGIRYSVKYISRGAFQDATISEISIPSSIELAANNVFNNCKSLRKVIIEQGSTVLSLGVDETSANKGMFSEAPITSLVQKRPIDNTNSLSPFYGNRTLQNVYIGGSVNTITQSYFFNCTGLKKLEIGESVNMIMSNAFNGCKTLNEVKLNSKTPIEVSPTAFSGIDLSKCKLIVPFKCKQLYENAEIWNKFGSIEEEPVARIYATDVFISNDDSFVIPINLENSFGISKVEFDIKLPTQFSFDTDKFGDYKVTITDRTTPADHAVSFYQQNDGSLRCSCYSYTGNVFKDSDGPILTIGVKSKGSLSFNSYPYIIQNVKLTDIFSNTYNSKNETAYIINEQIIMGDFNGDNIVNNDDVTLALHELYAPGTSNYKLRAVDFNKNRELDLGDIVAMIKEVRQSGEIDCSISSNDGVNISVNLGTEEKSVKKDFGMVTSLNNEDNNICAFMFDVVMPKSITTSKTPSPQIADTYRTTDNRHKLIWTEIDDSTTRVILFSPNNSVIAGDKGEIIHAYFHPEPNTTNEQEYITIKNIQICNSSAHLYTQNHKTYEINFYDSEIPYTKYYNLIYKVDGETYHQEKVLYGTPLTTLEEPVKEGYTFSGWSKIPQTMPANDLIITGNFNVNYYNVIYMVGDLELERYYVAYGDNIPTYNYIPNDPNCTFDGWLGEAYESMPAHDVIYVANIIFVTTIQDIKERNNYESIYLLNGKKTSSLEHKFPQHIYITNKKKYISN